MSLVLLSVDFFKYVFESYVHPTVIKKRTLWSGIIQLRLWQSIPVNVMETMIMAISLYLLKGHRQKHYKHLHNGNKCKHICETLNFAQSSKKDFKI